MSSWFAIGLAPGAWGWEGRVRAVKAAAATADAAATAAGLVGECTWVIQSPKNPRYQSTALQSNLL